MESPKWNRGDEVILKPKVFDDPKWLDKEDLIMPGIIEIVDRYGTFEQNEEPSYDVWFAYTDAFIRKNPSLKTNGDRKILYKHIRQSLLENYNSIQE